MLSSETVIRDPPPRAVFGAPQTPGTPPLNSPVTDSNELRRRRRRERRLLSAPPVARCKTWRRAASDDWAPRLPARPRRRDAAVKLSTPVGPRGTFLRVWNDMNIGNVQLGGKQWIPHFCTQCRFGPIMQPARVETPVHCKRPPRENRIRQTPHRK